MSRDSHRKVIAIDGPAAAGKTTVALALAVRVGAIFLDTGLLYRAITFESIRRGIDPSDGKRLGELVQSIAIAVRPSTVDDGRPVDVLIDGEDVTPFLRQPGVDRTVSQVSAHYEVRQELLPVQRKIAEGTAVVIVGRDIGTVVVPDAGVKIYLDASLEERARRRHEEQVAKGPSLPYETVLADLARRDAADSSRDLAPLLIASDAIFVPTDGRSIEEVVQTIVQIVEKAWSSHAGEDSVE